VPKASIAINSIGGTSISVRITPELRKEILYLHHPLSHATTLQTQLAQGCLGNYHHMQEYLVPRSLTLTIHTHCQ